MALCRAGWCGDGGVPRRAALWRATQGVFFMHTRKMGLGLGVKWGGGWLLMRTALDPPRWSHPVFYRVQEGSIGFTAGALGLQLC